MGYTAPTTRAAGYKVPASVWNTDLVNNITYLANPPACRVYHDTTQSVADSTLTALVFNSERFDATGMHSTSALTGRITFNDAGLYMVTLCFGVAAAADYLSLGAHIRLNGGSFIASSFLGTQTDANDNYYVTVTTVYKFAVADYIETLCWQNNTANAARNVVSVGNRSPEFAAAWIGLG